MANYPLRKSQSIVAIASATVLLVIALFLLLAKIIRVSDIPSHLGDPPINSYRQSREGDPNEARSNNNPKQTANRNPERKRESVFENLSPTQQSDDLRRRLSQLRDDITKSPDPGSLIDLLWKDIGSMGSFQRRIFWGAIENQLADLNDDTDSKLEWISQKLPLIEKSLEGKKVFEAASKDYLFSLLASNIYSKNIDPLVEIQKLPEGRGKSIITTEMLPKYITLTNADYRSFEPHIPSTLRDSFYFNLMNGFSNIESLRKDGLQIYLENKGGEDLHPELLDKILEDSNWVNENIDHLEEIASEAAPNKRRDLLLKALSDKSATR